MSDYVTDTHSLIWYLEDSPRLGREARRCFEACDSGESIIFVPTICLVEIIYLQEKGRIPAEMKRLLDKELTSGSVGIFLSDLTGKVVEMLSRVPRSDVPDMPDKNHCGHSPSSQVSPDQSRSQNSSLNCAYNLVKF